MEEAARAQGREAAGLEIPKLVKTLIVLDGYSLLFRAFFALPPMATKDGRPTNALYGFLSMLLKLLEERKPDGLVLALDAHARTFRDELYADYKAGRSEAPAELKAQLPEIRRLAAVLGIQVIEQAGFEADDVIGSISELGRREGFETLIVSGDMDTLQLVRDEPPAVRVMMTRRGISDTVVYDEAGVKDRYGITPRQVIDFKALKGDTSDNIPGAAGVGEKTAMSLVNEFGSVENLFSNLDKLKPGKIKDAIVASEEIVKLSKQLSAIHTEMPLPQIHLEPPQVDRAKAAAYLNSLQFRGMAERVINCSWFRWVGEAGDLFAEKAGAPLKQVWLREGGRIHAVASSKDEAAALGALADGDLAVALFPNEGGWIDLALGTEEGGGFLMAVPTQAEADGLFAQEASRHLCNISAIAKLFRSGRKLIGHEMKAVWKLLAPHGARFDGLVFDTQVAEFCLNGLVASPGLAMIAQRLLDRPRDPVQPPETPQILFQLAPRLEEELKRDGMWELFAQMEAPLVPILAQMEATGVRVDSENFAQFSQRLAEEIAHIEQEVFRLAGEEFSIGSTKQLQVILYEKMGVTKGRKTKTGFSTDAQHLEPLREEFPIVDKILQWREMSKLKSTYVDALPQLINLKTGRIHTTFNQCVAATGRLSSADPNLQNIPIRTELGRSIRTAFVPSPGNVLISCDYSQIELRCLAHLAHDPGLIEAFATGLDIHTRTAMEIFGLRREEVTSEHRRRAKVINFGLLYGMGERRVSREFGVPAEEARGFIQRYFEGFPNVKKWMDETLEFCRGNGYVSTLYGRRRYIPDILQSNQQLRAFAERMAINAPIQGTASDVMKLGMIAVARALEREKLKAQMILQVHDELLLDCPLSEADAVEALVRREMAGAASLKVPLEVDSKRGANWGEC